MENLCELHFTLGHEKSYSLQVYMYVASMVKPQEILYQKLRFHGATVLCFVVELILNIFEMVF